MIKLNLGSGQVKIQRGVIKGEGKCITLDKVKKVYPLGATQKGDVFPDTQQEDHDIIVVFSSLESARVFQDEIGELCASWSKELCPLVDEV